MFQRRNPLPLLGRLRALVWPRKGWRRASVYLAHRVRRLPGTPYRIAAGFASGAAISFTPFIGLHFVGAAVLALVLRGNLMASAIGTAVGNPWTFPVIWLWIYTFGQWMLGGPATRELPETLSLNYIFQHPLEILWPMIIGGAPTAVVAWFVFFWPVRAAVARYQIARRKRIRRRLKALRARAKGREAATRDSGAREFGARKIGARGAAKGVSEVT